jgi:Tol biopolymer transport system component
MADNSYTNLLPGGKPPFSWKRWKWPLAAPLILMAGLLIYHYGPRLVYRHFGHYFLKPAETQQSASATARIKQIWGDAKGKLVWSSSRTGTHQIYLLTLPDQQLYQLTSHPHVNFYPRLCPEGNRILFARSQRRWVSERDQRPWDIYLFDLRNGRETLVVKNGNFPAWRPDGEHLTFLRGDRVLLKKLGGADEKVLFNGRREPYQAEVQTPELSPRDPDLLAVTLRGKPDGVFLLPLSSPERFFGLSGGSCELTWMPDGREALWVENGGRGGTRIAMADLEGKGKRVLMDLPLRFSHEYFPKVSNDGRWLVWGASEGGHEHDLADYEIFLWKIGRPWEEAVRITHNPANDRWPDIHLSR